MDGSVIEALASGLVVGEHDEPEVGDFLAGRLQLRLLDPFDADADLNDL